MWIKEILFKGVRGSEYYHSIEMNKGKKKSIEERIKNFIIVVGLSRPQKKIIIKKNK
jgi:hypothetical protein